MRQLFLAFAIAATIVTNAQDTLVKKQVSENKKPAKQNVYTLQFDDRTLGILYNIIEQSDYSHKDVESIKNFIAQQLKKQVQTTSAK